MEDSLNNKVRMVNGVVEFVLGDASPYAGISQFPVVIGNVKTKMIVVNGLNLVAGGTTKGITLDVKVVRTAMESLADKLAKGTYAYAASTNNNELKQIVNWTDAKLSKLQKEDVDDKCEAICNAASAHAAALVPFGITAADITAGTAAVGLYRPLTGKTRAAQVDINSAKEQMQTIVSGIISNELKEQADRMIGTLKVSNTVYHDKYFKMREVLDLGSTSAKVRGVVRDDDTDAFLNGVVFTIYKHGETTAYKSMTTFDHGSFGISQIDAGDYDFEWVKAGYNTVREENVHIAAGKEIQRRVRMQNSAGHPIINVP